MLTTEENEMLTRIGPGTPMGEVLRRYWHPVGCSEWVTKKPQRVKVLGEELVLYRGESGRPALMQLRCAHRSVALDYGRVEGDCIRCPYHGWLYDTSNVSNSRPNRRAAVTKKRSASPPTRRKRWADWYSLIWDPSRRQSCRSTTSCDWRMGSG